MRDLSLMRSSEYSILSNGKNMKEVSRNATKVCCKSNEQHNREKHVKVEEEGGLEWRKVIGYMEENR